MPRPTVDRTSPRSTQSEKLAPQRPSPAPTVSRQLAQIAAAIADARVPDALKERLPKALRPAVNRFLEAPGHRGSRAATVAANRLVRRTLRRVELAIGHAERHPDGDVRRQAVRFLRACQSLSFDTIVKRSRRFRGLLNKAGHRRKEQALRAAAWRGHVDEDCELVEVVTVDHLRSVGRSLDLCVAHCDEYGRSYHSALRTGASSYYVLQEEGKPRWLMQVDGTLGEVEEIKGGSAGPVSFDQRQGVRILRMVNAHADDICEFASVGAFSPYVAMAKCVRRKSVLAGHRYTVDAFPDEAAIVVRQSPRPARSPWSLFTRRSADGGQLGCWREAYEYGMSEGELVDLLLRDADLAQALRRLFVD